MKNDVVFYITTFGNLIGTFISSNDESVTLENACVITPERNGQMSLVPIVYSLSDETKFVLNKHHLLGLSAYVPVTELRNAYSSQFGSGLQLLG